MCVQECVSEFISFITSGAIDKCQAEKRKTLNGEDILYAMYTLGFENYAETLKIYLAKYREHERLELDDRREKDRLKRQLRKERKEKERKLQMQRENGGVPIDDTDINTNATDGTGGMPGVSMDEEDLDDSELDGEDDGESLGDEEDLHQYDMDQADIAQYVLDPQPVDIDVYDNPDVSFQGNI